MLRNRDWTIKKNGLFAGSGRTGKRAAILALLGAVKLNGLNPAKWLADTPEISLHDLIIKLMNCYRLQRKLLKNC